MDYLSQVGVERMFRQWSEDDPNIESFGFGQLYNQNGEPKTKQKYFGMWVNPVDTEVNENTLDRSYEILIYDLIFDSDHGSNQNKVISDCEEIALRLIRFLKAKYEIFDITETPLIQPFVDKFLDDVSGVIINVTIEFNAQSHICDDPEYNFI